MPENLTSNGLAEWLAGLRGALKYRGEWNDIDERCFERVKSGLSLEPPAPSNDITLLDEARDWLQHLKVEGVAGHSILSQMIDRLDRASHEPPGDPPCDHDSMTPCPPECAEAKEQWRRKAAAHIAQQQRAAVPPPARLEHGGRPMTLRECMEAEEPTGAGRPWQNVAEAKFVEMRPEPPSGDSVPMPQNEAQAELMQKLGYLWLQQNAPHRLTKPPPARKPDGYAYRYPSIVGGTVISFDRISERIPVETIPFWLGSPIPELPRHAEPPTGTREQQLLIELAYWKARCGVMHGDETNAVTQRSMAGGKGADEATAATEPASRGSRRDGANNRGE